MFQESSLDFKLVQRICLLQQALDQSMDSLDELRSQLEGHHLLESQLAQTEKFSNVQQKIIATLRQQLDEKNSWQEDVLQGVLAEAQTMIDHQQLELERLRVRIQQSQAEVMDYLVRLSSYYQRSPRNLVEQDLELASEVMIVRSLTVSLSTQLQEAQQHIRELDSTLTHHQVGFARLRANLQGPETPIAASETLGFDNDPAALSELIRAQAIKLRERDRELSEQFGQQNQLKYRCQRLAAERDYFKQQLEQSRQANEALRTQLQCSAAQQRALEVSRPIWQRPFTPPLPPLPPLPSDSKPFPC